MREERKELFFFFSTSGVSRASRSRLKTHLINIFNIYFYSKFSLSADVQLILKESLYHNLSRSFVGKVKVGSSSKEETAPLTFTRSLNKTTR